MSDIFVDAALKPYNFYLCPPLDRSEKLVKMVEDNGGKIVTDFLNNCIVISSTDFEIPEELKTAHVYSYEVIQDSANRAAQQEFANYLIHVPSANNDSVPHQYNGETDRPVSSVVAEDTQKKNVNSLAEQNEHENGSDSIETQLSDTRGQEALEHGSEQQHNTVDSSEELSHHAHIDRLDSAQNLENQNPVNQETSHSKTFDEQPQEHTTEIGSSEKKDSNSVLDDEELESLSRSLVPAGIQNDMRYDEDAHMQFENAIREHFVTGDDVEMEVDDGNASENILSVESIERTHLVPVESTHSLHYVGNQNITGIDHRINQATPGSHSSGVVKYGSGYEDSSVRYFTSEEDSILMEELRKRHWMGIRGHHVYDEIATLPYFRSRNRTGSSLRERMRTLKFNVGFVYQCDNKNRLLKDEQGRLIKTTMIRNKLNPYVAADDLILSKTVYLKLDIVTDEKGFETVVFPTNFYDKFAVVYDSHTPESWRQRFKNYISIFGIANYLKYYIMERKQGREPLPVNQANKEWFQARKHIKKTDCPRLYFPHVPQENDFIDQNIEYTELSGYDNKIFEFDNPFRKPIDVFVETPKDATNKGEIEEEKQTEDTLFVPDVADSRDEETAEKEKDFVDEATTEFRESTFIKGSKKHGPPIDLEKVENKRQLINQVVEIFRNHPHKISPRDLSAALKSIDVKEYYSVFLIYRCTSVKQLIMDSLLHYIDTDGKELLAVKPGIWSNKCIDMALQHDPILDSILKKYHGEKSFRKQSRWIKTSRLF